MVFPLGIYYGVPHYVFIMVFPLGFYYGVPH